MAWYSIAQRIIGQDFQIEGHQWHAWEGTVGGKYYAYGCRVYMYIYIYIYIYI